MKGSPHRTCIGCRQVRPKDELARVVRGSEGRVILDRQRVVPGRGAYACPTVDCLERALTAGRLGRAFRMAVLPPTESVTEIVESWRRR